VLFRVGREVGQYLPLAFCKRHIPFCGWFANGPVDWPHRTFAELLR
jgi:hypothetical protein